MGQRGWCKDWKRNLTFKNLYRRNVNQLVSIFSATDSFLRSNSFGVFLLSTVFSISSASSVFSILKMQQDTVHNCNNNKEQSRQNNRFINGTSESIIWKTLSDTDEGWLQIYASPKTALKCFSIFHTQSSEQFSILIQSICHAVQETNHLK